MRPWPSLLFAIVLCVRKIRANRHHNRCEEWVLGYRGRVDAPRETRLSLCNEFLQKTVTPGPMTVTVYATTESNLPNKSSNGNLPWGNNTSLRQLNATQVVASIPTRISRYCSDLDEFTSACRCWNEVTPSTNTLPTPTATVTAIPTTWGMDRTGCDPAETAVSDNTRFKCSHHWGMCSCLKGFNSLGANEGQNDTIHGLKQALQNNTAQYHSAVCVHVGPYLDNEGNDIDGTGPCSRAQECGSDGECDADQGTVCVYDGSCECGKRRCYKEVSDGCIYQDPSLMAPV